MIWVFVLVLEATKSKAVAPPASRAFAPYFLEEQKVSKNSFRRCRCPATRGSLRCSRQAGRKELASLKHLFACFRLTLRSSAPPRLGNVKGKFKSKCKNHSRAGALPHKPNLGRDENCGSRPAGDVFRPNCQQCKVYEPRKGAEGTDRIGKHEQRRQANSTSIVQWHCGNAVLSAFFAYFLSQDTKSTSHQPAKPCGETPLTFKTGTSKTKTEPYSEARPQHQSPQADIAELSFRIMQS